MKDSYQGSLGTIKWDQDPSRYKFKLRAERKAGEMLAEMDRRQRGERDEMFDGQTFAPPKLKIWAGTTLASSCQ